MKRLVNKISLTAKPPELPALPIAAFSLMTSAAWTQFGLSAGLLCAGLAVAVLDYMRGL
jgi:hypothetical protein